MDLANLHLATKDPSKFQKACSTTGTASATSCGSAGFYAKASKLVAKYNGVLSATCQVKATINGYTITIGKALDTLTMLAQITGMLCVSHGGKYCYPAYMSSANNLGTPTQAGLAKFCTPCTNKMMESMMVAAGASAAAKKNMMASLKAIEVTCTKIVVGAKTTYCMPAMQVMDDKKGGTDKQKAEFMCAHPCGPLMMTKIMEMEKMEGKDVTMMEAQVTSQCFKHAGKFCGEYVQGAGKVASNHYTKVMKSCSAPKDPDVKPFPANPTTCSADCKSAMSGISSSSGWGCCSTSLIDGTNAAFKGWMKEQAKLCSVTMPAACKADAGAKPVSFKVCIANLKYSYSTAAATKAHVVDDVNGDVAMNLGVAPKLCKEAEKVTNSNGGSCFSVTCTPATATQTGNVAALANSFVSTRRSSAKMVMTKTSSLPASAKVDPQKSMNAAVPAKASCGTACPKDTLATASQPAGTPAASGAASTAAGMAAMGVFALHMMYYIN